MEEVAVLRVSWREKITHSAEHHVDDAARAAHMALPTEVYEALRLRKTAKRNDSWSSGMTTHSTRWKVSRAFSELSGITRDWQNYSREFSSRHGVNLKWLPQNRVMNGLFQMVEFSQAAMEHIDALYGYALALTRDTTEAEDLVQDTYLRAASASHQPESNVKSWLFVIMRNAWLNQVRHRNSGPKFVDLDSSAPAVGRPHENPHVVYLRKLEREQVQQAIQSLPDAYREVVVLRDIEGFTYQEIATVLNCPAGTVMSRLGRARGKLRKQLSSWQTKSRAKVI